MGNASAGKRQLILGTAGHVDHGKTELVRALTGHDTDRLEEEKRRGISILLGFAPLPLDDDTFLGIVDVPGHEKFVKQMVAGAGGIDLAMLLVAADEGVMPQTREHLAVLESLDVQAGIVVISKCDLGDEETIEIVRQELADLIRGSFLGTAPVIATSARTGEGIDDLRTALVDLAATVPSRDATGPFRLAVDRVFHQKGIGVVVTGSCYSGTVSQGDSLELLPSGRAVRVRNVQSFGEVQEFGMAGQRLALALQGARLEDVDRGDMLCSPGHFAATETIDGRLHLSDYAHFELKNRERVRFHHGASEVMGRVILLDSETLANGGTALAQLRLEAPLVTAHGDRMVVRKYSPMVVIGGCTVIDPRATRHKRFDANAIARLSVLEEGEPTEVLASTIKRAGIAGIVADDAELAVLEALVARGTVARVSGRAYHRDAIDQLLDKADAALREHHRSHPLQWGMDKEELRQRLAFAHSAQDFNAILVHLGTMRPLTVRGNRVRAGDEEIAIDKAGAERLANLERAIAERGVAFPSRSDLDKIWNGPEPLSDALLYLRDGGAVVEVGDGVIHRDAYAGCIAALAEAFRDKQAVSVSDLKDALGVSRKHAIPLLEALDASKVTTRKGNIRVRGPAFPAGDSG